MSDVVNSDSHFSVQSNSGLYTDATTNPFDVEGCAVSPSKPMQVEV